MQDSAALGGVVVVACIEAPNYDTVAHGGSTVGNRLRVDVFNQSGGEQLADEIIRRFGCNEHTVCGIGLWRRHCG